MMTADEQYRHNVDVLAKNPSMAILVQQLATHPMVNLQLAPTATGAIGGLAFDVAGQQWAPLCDLNDPIGEAQKSVEAIWSRELTTFTMIGLGLGYVVKAFAQKLLPYQRLVVWDVDAGLFKAMLHCVDVEEVYTGKRVEIYVGPEIMNQIEPWYMSLGVEEKLHMSLPATCSYTGVYRKPEYETVVAQVMNMMRYHVVGLSTWRMHGKAIGDNDIENMPEYFDNPGMEHLAGLWKDKPAVCVAAGPSLQKNLRLLMPADERSKVALITVGTVYGLLQGMGLQPDIVTTIDFQRLNWTDQFQYIPLDPECALVYLHSTYPQTPRRWPGPKFVATNSSDTTAWIAQYAEPKRSAGQVQTVAHLNLLAALEMGANPIILLGQDLSMPATEHHTAGARAQDDAPASVAPEAFVDAVDFQGKSCHTRHSFLSMLMVFERIVKEHPETTFINCSEQGLEIKGMLHMPLSEALAKYGHEDADASVDAYRPIFQGETGQSIARRRDNGLKGKIRQAFSAYAPQIKDNFEHDFAKLRQDVRDLGFWAKETITLFHDSELLPEQTQMNIYQTILASERVLQERPHAMGMFVIRRFDFIELRGEIPPTAEQVDTQLKQLRYAASRLARVAKMLEEEFPVIDLLLRRVHVRLESNSSAERLLARQRYKKKRYFSYRMRDWAKYLYHTQQYGAALSLLPENSAHVERIRKHLARYYADVRAALPKYFPQDISRIVDEVEETVRGIAMSVAPKALPVMGIEDHAHAATVPSDYGQDWHG